MSDATKAALHRYLGHGRDAVVWKLEGLSEYDVRRPLTPTGTNLLGLVKHLAMGEATYFGAVFGQPFPEEMPWWDEGSDPFGDMFATEDETREGIVALYRRASAHADATIEALDLEAPGHVSWWQQPDVTLGPVLVHVATETHRHAGHVDILREQLDGTAGWRQGGSNLPDGDAATWQAHWDRVEAIATRLREPSPDA